MKLDRASPVCLCRSSEVNHHSLSNSYKLTFIIPTLHPTHPETEPNSTTCRQVVTTEGVGLRSWPCHNDAYAPPGGEDNKVIQYLARGETVIYNNTDSKQTSACDAPPPVGVRPLCWIYVQSTSGNKGWIPAVRGTAYNAFSDAFCTGAAQNVESLVVGPCGKL